MQLPATGSCSVQGAVACVSATRTVNTHLIDAAAAAAGGGVVEEDGHDLLHPALPARRADALLRHHLAVQGLEFRV